MIIMIISNHNDNHDISNHNDDHISKHNDDQEEHLQIIEATQLHRLGSTTPCLADR